MKLYIVVYMQHGCRVCIAPSIPFIIFGILSFYLQSQNKYNIFFIKIHKLFSEKSTKMLKNPLSKMLKKGNKSWICPLIKIHIKNK